jgi:flagellar biosynthesis GTPase FlhF
LTHGCKSARNGEALKFKDIFPGICVALLIASEIFLFSANHQKSVALAQLAQARQAIQDLQSQLADATNAAASADADELTRLRADNQDLPRLRNQIKQLQAENHKLDDLLGRTSNAAAQQQQQLQEMQAENEQAAEEQQAEAQEAAQVAALAKAKQRETCIANLRLIYAAKQAWALDKNKTDTDVPAEQDLLPYIKGGIFPTCPSGGAYTIGAVSVPPTCSIPSHVLPAQ